MRIFYLLMVMVIITIPGYLFSQSSTTDVELQKICDVFVQRINNKAFSDRLIVLDFTDQQGTPSEMGAYFAERLSSLLVNSPGSFMVIDRPSKVEPTTSSSILSGIGNALLSLGDSTSNNEKYFTPRSRDKRFKKVEAMVYGSITEVGDHYRLIVKLKDKKTDGLIATAEGDITNTEALEELHSKEIEEEESMTIAAVESKSKDVREYGSRRSVIGQPEHVYQKLHLKFELLKCIVNGGSLELHFRITSEGKDSKLSIYNRNATIYNQNGGDQFTAQNINLAEFTSGSSTYVTKLLIRDTPISSVITFKPNQDIQVIGRFVATFNSPTTGNFAMDMRDIFVE